MDLLISFVERFLEDRFEDDAFDRLNYQITPFLFVLFSLVNISKVVTGPRGWCERFVVQLYIGSPINCFTKAEFRPGWIQYAHDYCLIENTYYLRTNESIPIEHETRGQKYISYYQARRKSCRNDLASLSSGSHLYLFYKLVRSMYRTLYGARLTGYRVGATLKTVVHHCWIQDSKSEPSSKRPKRALYCHKQRTGKSC